MAKVIVTGHMVVPGDDLNAAMAELPTHIELTRNEDGCLCFDVRQELDEKCVFSVYEEFADRTAFEAHLSRVKNSAWGKITANAERHYNVMEAS